MADKTAKSRLERLDARIIGCTACPRLIGHCREVARVKRAAFAQQTYWGRPVPNFGDPGARLLIVGLAPGAHGANRTGRMFTGDRSGDFLFNAMHAEGFANQAGSSHREDGLELRDCCITAACHCAPPDNKPLPQELETCSPFLDATVDALPRLKIVMCLGGLALAAVLRLGQRRGWVRKLSDHPFGHGVEHDLSPGPIVLCAYHPSQQNTFTGRLTAPMLRNVFARARGHLT